MKRIVLLSLPAAIAAFTLAQAQEHKHENAQALPKTASPAGAVCYIISPSNGATVPTTFTVLFGLKGMGVAPAGIDIPNTGHHHLLIDKELADFSLPIPADENHIHFGGGQTQAEVTLSPGKHTLQLFLADKNHVVHDPPVVSEKITVVVK